MRSISIAVLILFWSASSMGTDQTPALFNSVCAHCHNNNGDGKTAAGQKMAIPDLRAAEIQKLSDEELFQSIGNGLKHKQYPHVFLKKGLNEEQLRDLVRYVRSLKTARPSESQPYVVHTNP